MTLICVSGWPLLACAENRMKKSIAVFDSGIGGITFLRDAVRTLPSENFIYYADTDHVPYGTKPDDEVRRFVGAAVAFLEQQGIKALVIACNAATSAAVAKLRNKHVFPILGMEPAVKTLRLSMPVIGKSWSSQHRLLRGGAQAEIADLSSRAGASDCYPAV